MKNKTRTVIVLNRVLFFLFAMLICNFSFAQSITVTGTVKAENESLGLPGVNVVLKGTTKGVITNVDGEYSIKVPSGDGTLVFSCIGQISQEINIDSKTKIDVVLKNETLQLDELVVVGYGTQKKSDLTGAVSSVSSEEIENMPVPGIDQALQGKVAGVQINSNGGAPGSGSSIRIRGMGSIYGSNDPLYVVDGIPYSSNNIENVVTMSSIDRVEILKDASALAIYGSRAANGVIIITTKRGKVGEPTINLNAYYGIKNPVAKPNMATAEEYVRISKLAFENAGRNAPAYLDDKLPGDWGNGTNWWNEVMREKGGMAQNYDLSLNGGTESFKYATSFGYFGHEGYIKASEYNRFNFRLNTDYKFLKIFSAGTNISYTQYLRNGISENDAEGGVIAAAYQIAPIENVWASDEELQARKAAGYDITREINRYGSVDITNNSNVVRNLNQDNSYNRENLIFGNIYLQINPVKYLTLRSEYGFDIRRNDSYNFVPKYFNSSNEMNERSFVSRGYGYTNNYTWNNIATYAREIGKHNFSIMAGMTQEQYSYESLYASGRGTPGTEETFWYIDATQEIASASGDASKSTMLSFLGRAFYSYDNKYLLTVNVRRDGTSKFSAVNGNRWGTFPSASLGWKISNEPFFQKINPGFFDSVKLRLSWGQIGNQAISSNAYVSVIGGGMTDRYAFGPDEVFETGYRPMNNANPNVHWETQQTTNVGLDLGMFNNKLQITGEYFQRKSIDNLLQLPQPWFVGTTLSWANAGEIQNKGFEFTGSYRNKEGLLEYGFGGNISFIRNEVISLGMGGEPISSSNSGRLGGFISMTQEGHSIAEFYGYQTNGIFQNQEEIDNYVNNDGKQLQKGAVPGDFKFKDIAGEPDANGNPTGPDGVINDFDRTFIGTPHQVFVYGFNCNLGYKSFEIDASFQGQYGGQIFMYQKYYNYKGYESGWNQVAGLEELAWHGEGTSNTQPIISSFSRNNNFRLSDWWLSDASYLRLKNITLSYTIPKRITEKAKMSAVKVYVTGENMLTFTKYEGLDPEIGDGGGYQLELGVDRYTYPVAKAILGGIRITF